MEEKLSVRVRDVMEAAFLWCQDFVNFIGVSTKDNSVTSQTVYFEFEIDASQSVLNSLRTDYYNKKALVEPKMFLEKYNDAKNLLHEALRRNKTTKEK